MKKLLLPIAVLFSTYIGAQQSNASIFLPNIVPPSPTAYALGNYGNVPVGLFTGSPNVSIPLFTYKTKNITLPFQLSYSSNGIKVDEVSTNVGLGWSLNFGGVVTRMVRDRADETSTHIATPDVISGAYSNPVTNNFLYAVGKGSDALDTEADLYSFNFNGYSGKFFYDQNNVPHIVDQQAIKIERTGSTNGDGQDFLLTIPTGEKYYFTEKERTTYRSMGSGHSTPSSAITAWYLTKIVHPNGDEIYFAYDTNAIAEYVASQSQTLRMSVGYPGIQNSCAQQGGGAGGRTLAPSIGSIIDNTIEINGKKILSVSSNNVDDGTIAFEYEADSTTQDITGNKKIKTIRQLGKNGEIIDIATFNYLNTLNKRNFLDNIVFKDPKKTYSFIYETPEQFPERLSRMQDHWGYFTAVQTTPSLVPKDVPEYGFAKVNYGGTDKSPNPLKSKIGMLKKIIYPTKGYTELEYEGNTYWGEKTINPDLYTKQLEIKTDNFTNDGFIEYSVTSPIDQVIKIKATLTGNGIAGCSSFNSSGHFAGTVEIGQGSFYGLTRDNAVQEISVNIVTGETKKITLRADFFCSRVRADVSYYQTAPQTFNTNLDTGGVRVKSTKDMDDPTGQPIYKRYYYAHKDDITHSSGYKGRDPYYVDVDRWQIACDGAPGSGNPGACTNLIENSDLVLSSTSLISLYDTGTMSCVYPFVTISEGGDQFEKGGEMSEFKVHRNSGAINIWGPGNVVTSQSTNSGWDNGRELKSFILGKNASSSALDILQEKENVYEKNDAATFELKNFTGRMLFNYACGGATSSHPYTCTSSDVIKPNNLCTGKAAGTQVNLYDLENLNITEYRDISYWNYLKLQKTTDYLGGVPVKTQTEYFYDNPLHYQLTQQTTSHSDAVINETSYKYAHEKGNQLMIDKNMVGIPLETITTETTGSVNKVVDKTETIYPTALPHAVTGNLVLPLSANSYDVVSNIASAEITYNKYDPKGNIQQYTTKEGVPTTIIWGYNQAKPIAKIEGAKLSDISQSLIDSIVNPSNTDAAAGVNNDETSFLLALDNFRKNSALTNYQVTTYTYDPLVGVRSITQPSGIREVYVYDTANRLKEVRIREKDSTGNYVLKTVKEFKYNYKP